MKIAKRTAPIVKWLNTNDGQWTAGEKITCEVTGEMDDGTKVWSDIETGEQWFLMRMLGRYYFYKE